MKASESERHDLFWALRGGGGNFGIVTAFTFRCRPVGEHGTIVGGPVFYDLADTVEVMRWYRDLGPPCRRSSAASSHLVVPADAAVPRGAVGADGLRHRLVLDGAADRAEEVLAPLRTGGRR